MDTTCNTMLGQETTFSLVEVLQQPIWNFHFKVFRANTWNKMDHTMWKSIKTVHKNDFGVCVLFCLRPLVPLERCDKWDHCIPLTRWCFQKSRHSSRNPICGPGTAISGHSWLQGPMIPLKWGFSLTIRNTALVYKSCQPPINRTGISILR